MGRGVPAWRPREAMLFNCESKVRATLETPKCWRCQRVMRICPGGGAAHREWHRSKREKQVAGSQVGRAEPSKSSDIRHKATGFRVCSAGFGSRFDLYLLNMPSFLPFWNGNRCSVTLYFGSARFAF